MRFLIHRTIGSLQHYCRWRCYSYWAYSLWIHPCFSFVAGPDRNTFNETLADLLNSVFFARNSQKMVQVPDSTRATHFNRHIDLITLVANVLVSADLNRFGSTQMSQWSVPYLTTIQPSETSHWSRALNSPPQYSERPAFTLSSSQYLLQRLMITNKTL